MKILNLTQHKATADQVNAGVIEPADSGQLQKKYLNFDEIPSREEIFARAAALAEIAAAHEADAAMIGGAPYLMSALECELMDRGIRPLYAFSLRESVEEVTDDGSVVKKNAFRHTGFVQP